MREHFVVDKIKQLLQRKDTLLEESGGGGGAGAGAGTGVDSESVGKNGRHQTDVFISYCWANTDFVLSRLAIELAPRVRGMWLDRLGEDQGMGEFAQKSMQRGITSADVVIAVV